MALYKARESCRGARKITGSVSGVDEINKQRDEVDGKSAFCSVGLGGIWTREVNLSFPPKEGY